MISIVLDKDINKELKKQLSILDKNSRNNLLKTMQLAIVGLVQENIEKERSPDGIPWKKSLRAVLTGGKTLRNTSRLFQSIGTNNEIGDDFFTVGSKLNYASDHEEGNPKGQKARDYERIYARFNNAQRKTIYENLIRGFSGRAKFTPQRNFILNKDGSIPDLYASEIAAILEDFFNR